MTTAQPGQEQRMETCPNCNWPLLTPAAARPTADLGEDGELPAPSIFDLLEPLAEALVANGGPDIRYSFARGTGGVEIGSIVDQVRDRLILYREALEQIAAVDAPLGPDTQKLVTHIARAVLSRSEPPSPPKESR